METLYHRIMIAESKASIKPKRERYVFSKLIASINESNSNNKQKRRIYRWVIEAIDFVEDDEKINPPTEPFDPSKFVYVEIDD